MSVISGDYEKNLYKVDQKFINNEKTSENFEMLFLNRDYRSKHDHLIAPMGEQRFYAASLAVLKSTISMRAKPFQHKEKLVSGLDVNFSGPLFKDAQYINSVKLINESDIIEKLGKFQLSWHGNFPGTQPTSTYLTSNVTYFRKVIATISTTDDINHIIQLLLAEIDKFMINLFYGSVESNGEILNILDNCRQFCSHAKDSPFGYSLLAIISPRATLTGRLKKYQKEVKLELCDKIIVTADRKYVNLGSKKVIFVNCALILAQIKPNDYIHIDDITLRVIKKVKLSIECLIVQGGLLMPQRKVIFPSNLILNQVTAEELQDLTFCSKAHINTLVLPMPGCSAYYNSIRCAMVTLNCHNSRILARVYQSMVCGKDYAKWIAQTYDGIILCIDENPKSHQIIQFTEEVRFLIKLCYDLKKTIIISNFLPKKCFESEIVTVSPEDYKNFFFYPDAILVQPNELTRVHISSLHSVCDDIMARITDFAMEDLTGPFEDKSFTGSDTIARSIVYISYTAKVDAIIVNTISGRMAEKIAHFRPKCSIIALTKSIHVVRYLKIFHNINVAYYKEDRRKMYLTLIERQQLNMKKLYFGVLYGISRRILKSTSNVLYVCKNNASMAFPNISTLFRLDDSVIYNIIETMQ